MTSKNRPQHPFQVQSLADMVEGEEYFSVHEETNSAGYHEELFQLISKNEPTPPTVPNSKWIRIKCPKYDSLYESSRTSQADNGIIPYHNGYWNYCNWVRFTPKSYSVRYTQVYKQGISHLFEYLGAD